MLRGLLAICCAVVALVSPSPSGAATSPTQATGCVPFAITETADLTAVQIYVRGAPGARSIQGAVYSTSAGAPLNVKATTVPAPLSPGWQSLALATPVRVIPGAYCLRVDAGTTAGAADIVYGTTAFGAPDDHGSDIVAISPTAAALEPCTKYAAVAGSDRNDGTTPSTPYRTVVKLVSALAAHETGCLIAGGTFVEEVVVTRDSITLKTSPTSASPALFRGRIQFNDSANDGWIDNLRYDTYNADFVAGDDHGGLKVYGDRFRLTNSEIFSSQPSVSGICTGFGYVSPDDPAVGYANDVYIARNRFHDCGTHYEAHDHAVYLTFVDGATVEDNSFYDNRGGWGLHLFPDADNVTVRNNTIDGGGADGGGGIMVAGDERLASDDNTIEDNILTNPGVRPRGPRLGPYAFDNLETSWGGPEGARNTVTGNCVYSADGRNTRDRGTRLSVTQTIVADPLYVNPAAKDFRLQARSPCAGKGVREF